ncbi:MAG TPA: type IV pilin protein [Azoarcus taiwanensis]|nr:type IV pilin protein [Azoarcus taiwanensis]
MNFSAPRTQSGFTLIELMIVLAVIGILAAIAYPSFQRFVVKANRGEAHAALQQIQLLQETQRRATGTYADNAALEAALDNLAKADLYTYAITAASATEFTAVATAVGQQAAREVALFDSASCDAITLVNSLAGIQRTPARCWQ